MSNSSARLRKSVQYTSEMTSCFVVFLFVLFAICMFVVAKEMCVYRIDGSFFI